MLKKPLPKKVSHSEYTLTTNNYQNQSQVGLDDRGNPYRYHLNKYSENEFEKITPDEIKLLRLNNKIDNYIVGSEKDFSHRYGSDIDNIMYILFSREDAIIFEKDWEYNMNRNISLWIPNNLNLRYIRIQKLPDEWFTIKYSTPGKKYSVSSFYIADQIDEVINFIHNRFSKKYIKTFESFSSQDRKCSGLSFFHSFICGTHNYYHLHSYWNLAFEYY